MTTEAMSVLGDQVSPAMGSKKRKATTQSKFYAVRAGHKPGVYVDWNDCKESITGFKGANFKSFFSRSDAEAFVAGREPILSTSTAVETTRFYGVASGHIPGVYTDWSAAEEQIKGWKLPKYKKFATRIEAEAFVQAGNNYIKSRLDAIEPAEEDLEAEAADDSMVPSKRAKKTPTSSHGALGGKADVSLKTEIVSTSKVKVPARTSDTKSGPLRIYTDGSSLGNGKVGAVAGVGVFFGDGDTRNVSEPLKGQLQTNQRAELTAILRALEIAPTRREVHIITDSSYSINCVTIWYKNWERNNWLTSTKQPVMNKDLIEDILAKIRERQGLGFATVFNWIKGHSNDPSNEAADRLAVSGAQRVQAQGTKR